MLVNKAEKLVDGLVTNQVNLVSSFQVRIASLLLDELTEEKLAIIKALSEVFYHSSVILKELINVVDDAE